VVSPELGLVSVRDHEVPVPRGKALEVRAEGLWAECICETPMEHWSLGLEAFAVRLDEPGDAYRGEIGERVPLGLDLEWEATTPVYDYPSQDRGRGAHYEHAGIVHGEVLIGDERIAFEGHGERDHSWGERDWWRRGWHWSAFQIGDALAVNAARADEADGGVGYVWRLGEELEPIEHLLLETHLGVDEIPTAARYVVNGELEVDVEVLAVAPVPLVAPDRRTARFPRALCRFCTSEGVGTGWAEWLQPGLPVTG
jgi:hypothetical protein